MATNNSGCSSTPKDQPFTTYFEAAGPGTFTPVQEVPQLEGFTTLLGKFERSTLQRLIPEVYDETFYFNDTFHTFTERDALQRYLVSLADAGNTEVTFLDASVQGSDVWVRWRMRMEFEVAWKEITSDTPGISHLRFNEAGKIILQQDFWDSSGGFYERLPMLGSMIRAVRQRLGESDAGT